MDELEAWVAARGQSALWNKSVASGFFALAGKGKVTAEVVAMAVGYARDAGMADVSAMEKLGALVVEWSASRAPVVQPAMPTVPVRAKTEPPVAPPIRATPGKLTSVAAALAAIGGDVEVPPPPSVEEEQEGKNGLGLGLGLGLDPARSEGVDALMAKLDAPAVVEAPAAIDPAAVYAELETAESGAIPVATPPPVSFESTTPMSISIRAPEVRPRAESQPLRKLEKPTVAPAQSEKISGSARATLIAVGVVAAGLVAWVSWPKGGAESAEASITRVDALELDIELPDGWRAAPPRADKTALLYRGDVRNPDEQLFLAIVAPVKGEDGLMAIAKQAEDGAAARLGETHAAYHGEGCEKAKLANTIVCRGSANREGDVVALNAYVRSGAERAVLAVFVVRAGDGQKADDAIVGSLTP